MGSEAAFAHSTRPSVRYVLNAHTGAGSEECYLHTRSPGQPRATADQGPEERTPLGARPAGALGRWRACCVASGQGLGVSGLRKDAVNQGDDGVCLLGRGGPLAKCSVSGCTFTRQAAPHRPGPLLSPHSDQGASSRVSPLPPSSPRVFPQQPAHPARPCPPLHSSLSRSH